MPIIWIVSIIALWLLVLFETALLLLLTRSMRELSQKLALVSNRAKSPNNAGLDIGEVTPDFAMEDKQGKKVKLSDFAGQPRIIAFISPGCAACETTVDALADFYEQDKTITLLLVGSENRTQNREYEIEHGNRLSILTPTTGKLKDLYEVQGIPFLFFVDQAGIIRAKGVVNTYEHLRERLEVAGLLSFTARQANADSISTPTTV